MQWDDYTTNEANIRRQWIGSNIQENMDLSIKTNGVPDDFPVNSWTGNDIAPVGLLVCVFL